jgi:hypothetical protein
MENVRHRPGAFKQQNKAHKTGRHRSKGQIDNTNKGKVEVKALTKHRKQQSRDDRKNRLNQLRKTKREEILNKKRLIGGLSGAPHIVVLISNFTFIYLHFFTHFHSTFKSILPLSSDVSCVEIVDQLIKCDPQAKSQITETGSYMLE